MNNPDPKIPPVQPCIICGTPCRGMAGILENSPAGVLLFEVPVCELCFDRHGRCGALGIADFIFGQRRAEFEPVAICSDDIDVAGILKKLVGEA